MASRARQKRVSRSRSFVTTNTWLKPIGSMRRIGREAGVAQPADELLVREGEPARR